MLVDEKGKAELVKQIRLCQEDRLRVRLHVIRLAYTGVHSLEEIAELTGRARSMVVRYIDAFREKGVEGLYAKPKGGRREKRCTLNEASQEGLIAGLKEGKWKRARDIQEWLEKRHGQKMSLGGLYKWLWKRKAKPKVPRKSHAKKDPAKAKAFKGELAGILEGLKIPEQEKVRVWVADEHRYGLISVIRRVWSWYGVKPTAPYHTKYEWGYLYSALEVDGENRSEAMFMSGVCLESSLAFLKQIQARDPESHHVVIWDQAGFHQKPGDQTLPGKVHIVSLPAYSPELNPVEKIGDYIKSKISNVTWNTLPEIEAAIEEELRPIWQLPQRVKELIGHSYLVDQVNNLDPLKVHIR